MGKDLKGKELGVGLSAPRTVFIKRDILVGGEREKPYMVVILDY